MDFSPPAAFAQTRTLRIVTYNIEADIGVTNKQPTFTNVVTSTAAGAPLPGLVAPPTNAANVQAGGVLEGIGEELVNGNAQAIDVLALQETTGNPQTVTPIVNALNAFYGVAGMYSNSDYQATESGGYPGSGNGPNAIVFNTRSVQLLASVPVDPPGGTNALGSATGEYREVMRYEFVPAGVATNAGNIFYIYVSHYKSGGSSYDADRAAEAQIIRTNEALDLPAAARVLYAGDYNITTSGDPSYQIILSNAAPNGVQQGAGMDPFNPGNNPDINWHQSTTGTNLLAQETDNSEFIQYRDDLQLMTSNVYSGAPGGLKYVPGSYHTFGNNGSIAYQASVNNKTNTALNHLATNGPVFIGAAQLLVDLTGASDHLPVVADYTIPVPAPIISGLGIAGTHLLFTVTNGITNASYTVLMSTNLMSPPANWIAIATNTAGGGSFAFTATNAPTPGVGAPQTFFILQGK